MKYKIGDKVRYLKNTTYSKAIVGEEYYINKIDNIDMTYSLGKEKGKYIDGMWIKEDDIELVEEKEEYKEGEEVEVVEGVYSITIDENV